jgi:hypothetical protein
MKTTRPNTGMPQLSAVVAPEDLNCGDFVAALNVIYQLPSFMWGCDSSIPPDEPVLVQFRAPNAGMPLKIKAICLPFVFVKSPNGNSQTMDVRQTQFVRLQTEYAEHVWKELK